MTSLRSLLADQRGNSLVEMAFVAPLLAALMVGTVDISRAYSARVKLEQAAQRAIEKVQVSNYDVNSDNPTIKADAEAAAGDGSTATVTDWLQCGTSASKLAYTDACASGVAIARYVQVSITNTYTPMFGTRFFPGANPDGSVPLTAVAGVRVE
jgi:Flp pilus assembly protein TadG